MTAIAIAILAGLAFFLAAAPHTIQGNMGLTTSAQQALAAALGQ